MIRKILCTFATVGALALAAGCDNASSSAAKAKDVAKEAAKEAKEAAKDAKEAAKDAKETVKDAAKDALDAGKAGLAKISDLATKEYPAIETKINGLSGDAKTKATEAFAALKKAAEDAKAFASDPAKWKAAWEDVTAKLAALKKQVGL